MNGLRLSDEQVVELREKYAAGARQVDLAAEYGINQNTVSSLVTGRSRRTAGGPLSPNKSRKLTADDVVAIRIAVADGTPTRELTSRYGVSSAMIYNVSTGRAFADIGGPLAGRSQSRSVPLTVDLVLEIQRRVRAGESRSDVATAFGISRWTVDSVMSGRTTGRPANRRFDSADVRRMRTVYQGGMSQEAIAREYDCDQQLVSMIVRGLMYGNYGGPIAGTQRRRLAHGDIGRIREAFAAGTELGVLAARYDIDRTIIKQVVTGATYQAAPGPVSKVDRFGNLVRPEG